MRFRRLCFCIILCFCIFCSCSPKQNYFGEVPNLVFTPLTHTEEGKPCFYLFDDNPEYLHKEFLADEENPSSIAHFDSLTPGVYTVFSYHHRGDAAAENTDLFFDVLFRTDSTASFKITKLGLDHDWQWNQAWADYSGVDVFAPVYLKTIQCVCPKEQCQFAAPDGMCQHPDCPCTIKGELTASNSTRYDGLHLPSKLDAGSPLLLSQKIPTIRTERINEIRHGGYTEPIWLMMEFEILSGEMTLDTIAYTHLENVNFDTMKPGKVAKEPQYKGIAQSAPVVETNLSYSFDDSTRPGPLPIKIYNQRHPNGYLSKDGSFGTNVNTWKRKELVDAESAESDLLALTYKDNSKLSLYGSEITQKDNTWHFDPYHTSLYDNPEDSTFSPNIPMSEIDYPTGKQKEPPDFYRNYVLNLGNFGVRYLYRIQLTNQASSPKTFCFSINSLSGQLYRYSLFSGKTTVKDDGGRYLMKKFDMDPAEDPTSTTEPKARLNPAKYTTSEKFTLEPKTTYLLQFEVVTLTGCDAPMTNYFRIE